MGLQFRKNCDELFSDVMGHSCTDSARMAILRTSVCTVLQQHVTHEPPQSLPPNPIQSKPIQITIISHIPTNDAASSGAKSERPKYEECAKMMRHEATKVRRGPWGGVGWEMLQYKNGTEGSMHASA